MKVTLLQTEDYAMSLEEMPLFPLNTVLFPGGTLPLRIFEPRYVSMVGERMRSGQAFGVVLLREGQEAGEVQQFFATGTAATIVDFDQLDDGMLGITCRGGAMLRVQSQRRQADKLLLGEVELLPPEPPQPVPEEYAPMVSFLRHVLDQDEAQSYRQWLQEDWQNTEWVGCRLAELLPLEMPSKQALLETDGLQRLQILFELMKENKLFDQQTQ